MRGEHERAGPGEVAEAAAQWFARLQDDTANAEDWLAFETWFGDSSARAAAYELLERVWVDLDGLGDDVAAALDAPVRPEIRRLARRGQGLSRRGWLAAGGWRRAGGQPCHKCHGGRQRAVRAGGALRHSERRDAADHLGRRQHDLAERSFMYRGPVPAALAAG